MPDAPFKEPASAGFSLPKKVTISDVQNTREDVLRAALLESKRLNGDPFSDANERTAPVNESLSKAISEGFREGLREALKDEELVRQFWSTGYRHLADSASNSTSQWIGKRILVSAGMFAFGWLMVWLAKNGAFTK